MFARKVLDDGGKQHSTEAAFDVCRGRKYFYNAKRKDFLQPDGLPDASHVHVYRYRTCLMEGTYMYAYACTCISHFSM